MRKIKLTKLEERNLNKLVNECTENNEIDFIKLNKALNAPYIESNKRFWDKLLQSEE